LTPKALSFNQGERGSIALDQIKGISIEKFSNVAKLTLNNNSIGILRMYKIERLDRFLNHMMDILYKQLDHKV
jgi:hypothetical protein